ncbi:threonine/serine exporter family protein [uncultured Pseudokineococcus sp.]|uniref:threonine/serine ThrE exporter family protein n=1 Tax=uncultured Pseudokineococcus sp. TaxID=1642928 RepID=UPI0026101AD8|nr:threonine/serine exporter family protein [uncultured Pseudokineococcus sp.]
MTGAPHPAGRRRRREAPSAGPATGPTSVPTTGSATGPLTGPTTGPTATGSGVPRGGGQARTAGWRRRVIGEEEQTRPVLIVDRLRGTPFASPYRMAAPADPNRQVDLLLRLAVLLLRSGSGTAEVESSVVAAAVALGLSEQHLDLDITYSSITVAYAPADAPAVVRLQVVRSTGTEYARLSAAHALVLDLVEGRLERADVAVRLAEVESSPRPYRRWMVQVAWGLLAVAVVARLGGGPLALLTGFVMALAVDAGARAMSRAGAPAFFTVGAGAFIAGSLSSLLTLAAEALPPSLAGQVPPSALVVASGIVVLLPGGTFVAAVEDALRGFPVTAAARLVTVLMTTAAVLGGVVLALDVARRAGVPGVDPDAVGAAVGGALTPLPVVLVSTALGAGAAAVAYRTPPRLLLVTAVAAAAGQVALLAASDPGGPRALGTLVAALVVGAVGRVAALRRRATPLAVVVPGTIMLLPGLTIYTALVELTGGTVISGLVLLGQAGAIALAIGAGASLGDSVAAPVERGLDQASRRRRETPLRS